MPEYPQYSTCPASREIVGFIIAGMSALVSQRAEGKGAVQVESHETLEEYIYSVPLLPKYVFRDQVHSHRSNHQHTLFLGRERISTCVCCCDCEIGVDDFRLPPSPAILLVGIRTTSVNLRRELIFSFVVYMILLLLSLGDRSS